ncbi:hypothetical protein V1511DRAFT_527545 [Dipodascopsis uninucleata]
MASLPDSPAPLTSRYILAWTVEDVCNWLCYLGLQEHQEGFRENDITGEVLVHLDHEVLKDLGVNTIGHRLQILKAIYNIKIAQDIPIEPGQFVSLSAEHNGNETFEYVDVQRLIKSLELRDQRIMQAEQEIRRLVDNYNRLREDLLPIFKLAKESKPLPKPDTSPAYHSSVQSSVANRHSMFVPQSSSFGQSFGPQSSISKKPSTKKISTSGSSINPVAVSNASFMQSYSSSSTKSPTHSDWADHSRSTVLSTAANSTISTLPSGPSASSASSGLGSSSVPSSVNHHSPKLYQSTPSQGASQSTSSTLRIMSPSSGSGHQSLAEPFKAFKLKEEPCYKVLPAIVKDFNINDDWRQYALLLSFEGQERILGMDEKPLSIIKEMQDAGKSPTVFLRPVQGGKHVQGTIINGTPGGVL